MTYRGHLYVSAETHFAQGNDGMESHKFIIEQDGFSIADNIFAAGFKSGKPSINIPKTTCSPGFQGGDPLYRVIAEDLSASEAGDFDFNDVVFDVVKAEGGVTTLKLICAGGVLPLRVRGANQAEGTEIHSLFGENEPNEKGEYKMYNTGLSPKMPEAEFTVEGTYTTPEQIRNIIIEVKKDDKWMELKAETGKAELKQVRLHVRFWSMTRSCLLRRDRTSLTRMVISPTTYKAISWMTSGGSNGFIAENIKGSLLQAGLF